MAKTAQKNHSAIAEAGNSGNTPEEVARLAEINLRLADLAADPAIEQERAAWQALMDEDAALRQLAQERYNAPDFSYARYLEKMTKEQAKRFCDEVDTIGVLTDEESQRLEAIRAELDLFPLPSEQARRVETRALQAEHSAILAAPGQRKARREAEVALESASEIYAEAAQAMQALEADMAAIIPRLQEIKRQSAVAMQAEIRGKELAKRAGLSTYQLFGDGVKGFDGVSLLHLFRRVAKSVTDQFGRTSGPVEPKKSALISERARRCTLNWVNSSDTDTDTDTQEFEGEYQDA